MFSRNVLFDIAEAIELGPIPAVSSVAVLILSIPLNTVLTRMQARWEEQVMKLKDSRVKAVSESLQVSIFFTGKRN